MGISGYIREIGRGREGARSLERAQILGRHEVHLDAEARERVVK